MDRTTVIFLSLVMVLVVISDVCVSRRVFKPRHRRFKPVRTTLPYPTTTTPYPTTTLTTTTPCIPSSGHDPSSNWCYGTYCDPNGNPIHWDNFNCYTTTPIPTTPPTTIPKGCYYNHHHYAPGTTISEGSDRDSNWCWHVFCDHSGAVLHGDNFNCFTSPPTTVQPTTIPPSLVG